MKRNLLLLAVFAFFAVGCSDKQHEEVMITEPQEPVETPVSVPANTIKVNEFVYKCMKELYLWEAKSDWSKYEKNYKTYTESSKLFNEIKYEYDYWSYLTDDIEGLNSQFEGVTTTFGYDLIFFRFSNVNSLFAIVLYTYPGSPAEKAGIKRGDIIIRLNGDDITTSNYKDLLYASSITVNKGIDDNNTIKLDSVPIQMQAIEMYDDPIKADTVIVKGSNKIGYLCYTGYQGQSEQQLIDVFSGFKSEGVTDVVLDLRYNGGGLSRTAQLLSSILAPASVVKSKSLYLSQEWNDAYKQYWKSKGEDMNEYFIDTLPVNMDLSRLYVLTGNGTASASEATIVALKPYMDVVLIGDTTYGKYCGGVTMSVKNYFESKRTYSNVFNWGMYVMVYEFANRDGETEFVNGLAPKFYVEEDYFNLYPFGDERDPLLGKAIEQITGEKYVETKSSRMQSLPPYTIMRVKSPTFGLMLDTKSMNLLKKR